MILSNVRIHQAIDDGRLCLDPEPTPRFSSITEPDTPYQSTAVDLRLGTTYSIPKDPGKNVIDLSRPGSLSSTLKGHFENFDLPATGYTLEPGQFILAQTLEVVHLRRPEEFEGDARDRPALAARVEGKSSLARLGLVVHMTAPTIHNGFGPATIALEILCNGKVPLLLKPGIAICQLIFEAVDGSPVRYESQFQKQQTPTG